MTVFDYIEIPRYIIKEYRDGKLYCENIIKGDLDNANKQFDIIINSNLCPNIHYKFVLFDNYKYCKIREYDSATDSSGATTIED